MKTYYIVKHFDSNNGNPYWTAHKDGWNSRFGVFDFTNSLPQTTTEVSADKCEWKLRNILNPQTPTVVRVVKV